MSKVPSERAAVLQDSPNLAEIGQPAPPFELQCVDTSDGPVQTVRSADYRGRWLMLLFYPRDFSFVCPTELTAFSSRIGELHRRRCGILGISVDTIELHREWLSTPPAEGGLGPLQFPLASDPQGEAARAYGVWVPEKEVSTRGLFVVDPQGIMQYFVVHNLSVGRSVDEVLRVLDALQNGGLCPVNWTTADGTLDPEAALQPGRVLGHYRIRKPLGTGGFGGVFAAQDLRLNRTVAIKVLKGRQEESRDTLMKEARAAAALNHPNVCTIYAIDEVDGLPVITMEYLPGRSLTQVIANGVTPEEARSLARQIASGLAAAHAEKIVHGDLKPANVIVSEDGTAKILDFGLARSLKQARQGQGTSAPRLSLPADAERDPDVTMELTDGPVDTDETVDVSAGMAERLSGTPAYLSPEKAEGLAGTESSDVFALALILYEMLTGQRALAEESLGKLVVRLQMEDFVQTLVPRVAEPFRPLLESMLQRDSSRRPTAAEVARQL